MDADLPPRLERSMHNNVECIASCKEGRTSMLVHNSQAVRQGPLASWAIRLMSWRKIEHRREGRGAVGNGSQAEVLAARVFLAGRVLTRDKSGGLCLGTAGPADLPPCRPGRG